MEILAVLVLIAGLLWVLAKTGSSTRRKKQVITKSPQSDYKELSCCSCGVAMQIPLNLSHLSSVVCAACAQEAKHIPQPISKPQPQANRSSSSPTLQSLNTGIPELDGPGMWHRFVRLGSNAHVAYLLYSKAHGAYKIGIIDPDGLASRIQVVRRDVPDVVLAGTRVFTSRQNAFDAEQSALEAYKQYSYKGIPGRYSGRTEWITVRPAGRHNFTSPSRVEEMYEASLNKEALPLDIPDNYTVYLLHSAKEGVYRVSWCKSDNLSSKIRAAKRTHPDAILLSRFKLESKHKARAIAITLNEEAGSYTRDGRLDVFEWTSQPALSAFDRWDGDGNRNR